MRTAGSALGNGVMSQDSKILMQCATEHREFCKFLRWPARLKGAVGKILNANDFFRPVTARNEDKPSTNQQTAALDQASSEIPSAKNK